MQGEGRNTGRAAVFIRFAGCNLRCSFCDTEFESYREMSREEILAEISRYEVRGARCEISRYEVRGTRCEISRYEVRGTRCEDSKVQTSALRHQTSSLSPLIVLTGGEPTLQVDEAFVDFLHQHGYEVSMESNGTRPAPQNLDWLTVSPKSRGTRYEVQGKRVPDEIKLVFDEHTDPEAILPSETSNHSPLLYLQPCDTGDAQRNKAITQACVEYIKQHPQWRLSLQTHKLIDIE